MNTHSISAIGQFALKTGGIIASFAFTLLGTFRSLVAPVNVEHDNERQLLDTDLIGEFNHRTGRVDAGNDPYGWYEED